MRARWRGWERWLREQWKHDTWRTTWHRMQDAARTTAGTATGVATSVVSRRSPPPVATMVGDVLQVDPIQAVQWHRAWLAYLHAKALEVEQRQCAHDHLAEGETS